VLRCFGISDVGCVRASNEDSYALEPELGLYLVADGMGGAQAGELASSMAVQTIIQCVREAAPTRTPESLFQAVHMANRNILQRAAESAEFQGMGTTVVAALVDLPSAFIVSVGDSRLYLWRAGRLRRITSDQTWVNEIGRGLGLTDEQIHVHPFRHVLTMAVGARERIVVHNHRLRLEPADLLLLCSDGLHGVIGEEVLALALEADKSLAEKGKVLISLALRKGGPDNITAVLVENQPE